MSSSRLNNRAESHFRAQEEHELETLGKRAWDNPVYNGSPSSSLKIRAIYNPKATLENPYENTETPSGPLPCQDRREAAEGGKEKRPLPSCCVHIFKGIRVGHLFTSGKLHSSPNAIAHRRSRSVRFLTIRR
ncbi:UNVERIFIED_CONTAM: hypothetical protein K2H54_007248 [Gekko kuhli]